MKEIKENAITKQKRIIAELRENNSSESSREIAIAKLNLIVDDYENDKNKIDIDNIHLYYEFMSDRDIINYSSLIGYIFKNRFKLIMDYMPSFCYSPNKKMYGTSCINPNLIVILPVIDPEYNAYLKLEYFGIKDTLKPIEDYISEIKQSEQYKKYISERA